ncbi:speedy protein 1-A-like [Bufo bufo]|uniref:speedy protein 1-A-like n=1 Tax=Bufo bufo TaxID=8384 RepID=UPI001ABDD81B|nr:speedy protein 1-A-like [Bufo bufo]
MAAFFSLLEDENIRLFLARDSCRRISDKYLLAMVFIYFRRGRLHPDKYRKNFFPALFLANQFEEEEGRFRREIYPWALGRSWYLMKERKRLFHRRNLLFLRMGFKAWVDKESCDLIMAQDPLHWAWTRERQIHHGAAVRSFRRNDEEFTIYGPWSIPPSCPICETILLHPCAKEAENIMCQADTEDQPGTSQS